MTRYKNVNGVRSPLTAEEEIFRDAQITRAATIKQAEADAKAQKAIDAKEGNNKLIGLGLTQDQVTAMTGYVPPSIKYQNLIDSGKTPEEATEITGYTPEGA